MNVTVLSIPDSLCDEFVKKIPDGKLEHLPVWGFMIERVFGHKAYYLVARDGNDVQGVLPIMQIRSRLFGNRMISQAFSTYGGPLVSDSSALYALYEKAVELAIKQGCESMELRNIVPLPYDLQVSTDKVCMCLPLPSDPEELWRSLKSKMRKGIRKARKSGITIVAGGEELLDEFYELYTVRMGQFGTPCYPYRLFKCIIDTFPSSIRLFTARLGKVTVGVAFCYSFNGFAQIRWGGIRVEYNSLCPNTLLCWSAMEHYSLSGALCFDFGRSKIGSRQQVYKEDWGATPTQLYYQFWARPGYELSLTRPDNPRYKKKVKMWKKLPLWMTRIAGPYISRSLA